MQKPHPVHAQKTFLCVLLSFSLSYSHFSFADVGDSAIGAGIGAVLGNAVRAKDTSLYGRIGDVFAGAFIVESTYYQTIQ